MLITLNSAPPAAREPTPPIEFVLRKGQVVQLVMLVVTIMLLTSATSFVMGRISAEPPPAATRPAAPQIQTPTAAPVPAPTPDATTKVRDLPPVLVEGATYLQVAAVDPLVGEVFVEFLKRKYFSALTAPGPDASSVRVLVGPVRDDEAYQTIREDLLRAGFLSFPKKWRAESPVQAPGAVAPAGTQQLAAIAGQ